MTPLRQLQLTELNILRRVTEFLDENDIPYVALGGTLLGAVRHKGFIPWDDDVDIGIPREDYERFLTLAQEKFNGQNSDLMLKNYKIDKEYIYYFSRVIDTKIKLKDNSALVEKEQFSWIDIFPLDGMPDGIKQKIHKFRLLVARMKFQYSQFSTLVSVNLPNRPLHERILIGIGKILPVEKMFSTDKALRRLDKLLTKYPYKNSPYAVNFMGAGKFREMHEKSIYDNRAEYDFEDMKIKSVKDYDKWLTQMYGDYMTPPKDDEKNKHFTTVMCEEKDE